jgi:hypothetical protein
MLTATVVRPALVSVVEPAPSAYAVTHVGFDSEYGWIIELTNSEQFSDGSVEPAAVDLPDDVRAKLLDWLQTS